MGKKQQMTELDGEKKKRELKGAWREKKTRDVLCKKEGGRAKKGSDKNIDESRNRGVTIPAKP